LVEERTPDMIVKHFGCTEVHMKALYKCLIYSFIYLVLYFTLLLQNKYGLATTNRYTDASVSKICCCI